MFILIVSRGYPTVRYPLNGIFEFDQARALAESGHKVIYAVVDLRSIRRWRKWGVEHFIKDNVEIYTVNIPLGRMPHFILCHIGMLGLSLLYRIVQRDHGTPDIIHAHFLNMAEIALCLKSKSQAKFVMTEHSSSLNGEYAELPKWVKDNAFSIYNRYDMVICVSPMLSKNLNKFFNIKNTIIIPNMLDNIFISRTLTQKTNTNFEFVFVGAINERKSPLECILAFYDAFHEINFNTSHGKIHLRLIGGGPLFNCCIERIKELKLENNVFMMGEMTRDKIADVLGASDCFVLPSKLETFGVVYIEAMACGLPVIATKCGGPEYFVNKSNGILLEVGNHKQLVHAMQTMLENNEKYEHVRIAIQTKAIFSPKSIANMLINKYRNLLR